MRPACLSACLLPSPAHVPAPFPLCLKAVHVAENGTHYVSMTSLIPHLVAALQSLHCQQLAQDDDLDDLRERVGALFCACLCARLHMCQRVCLPIICYEILSADSRITIYTFTFIPECLPVSFILHSAAAGGPGGTAPSRRSWRLPAIG